jgi:protein PhnA
MNLEQALATRSEEQCELCGATEELGAFLVPPSSKSSVDQSIWICCQCRTQIEQPDAVDVNHWRCLNESMWSQVPAVQVVAWRMLTRLSAEGWPQELLDMLYLDDETLAWAQAIEEGGDDDQEQIKHLDSNGVQLAAGDTVTLIKDLVVKGANFTAKRGTVVRGISLVPDNGAQIEGRVNGQQIVLLTQYVKKN